MVKSFADYRDNLVHILEARKLRITGIDRERTQMADNIPTVGSVVVIVHADTTGICLAERVLHSSEKVGLIAFDRKEVVPVFFRICLTVSGLVFPASAVTMLPVRSCASSRLRAVGASPQSLRHGAWSITTPTSGRYNDTSFGCSPWSSMAPRTTLPSSAMTVLVVLIPQAPSHSTAMSSSSAGSMSCRQYRYALAHGAR